ncbi:MaoC/PaaZ C-terminal domain-containing protein [Gordonia hydrophobica]|uniref:MaoC/PaaZ C-terminal domain-containing protein n=1 Tax=Gordonia hydrophobica TaxID=40516 RepID=A0ABZ2U6W5_9ACTN|nr:MaoC/PaaZ C-terminal domain-containing protein [Gordonia hydrophobica]MBM7366095.1 acyl dehydratase [Gordonia hydrophobica]
MSTEIQQRPIVYGRDIEPGQVFGLSEFTLTKEELVAFAERWDPQGFHVDEDVADAGVYGGLIASGVQTFAILQRLSVLDVYDHWAVIAGKSMRDVAFLRPVRPGDTLTGSLTVTDVAFDDRNRALVEVDGELTVDGKPVMSVHMASYVHAAPPLRAD